MSYTQPERPEDIVVKRIIGMPGDFVCVNPDPEDVRNRGKMLQVSGNV